MSETASLKVRGKTYELPLVTGSEGETAVDIQKLRGQSGVITLDNGYANTGSCTSSITFIDGEKGILRFRGYPIEQLAEMSSFLEVTYLLIWGRLPKQSELDALKAKITQHTLLHEDMRRIFDAFPPDAHPMAILSSVVCGLSTYYQGSNSIFDPDDVYLAIIRILAKLPTIAAFSFRKSLGQPIVYPDNSMNYTENFMKMMFSFPTEDYHADSDIAHALDVMFILHADHEQNCSTSTVRLVGSAQANLYAAISSGICALWGPLHGGANQKVLDMLHVIQNDGGDVKKFVAGLKSKDSKTLLMGFGHRVYKNFDPRATIIKHHCDVVLGKLKRIDPLLDIAKELEEIALADDYFIERKLYPNVDFYSGLIYRALGFPTNMFTVLFAMGRLPGWIAQWKEMIEDPVQKIGRPRQLYTGAARRDYVDVEDR